MFHRKKFLTFVLLCLTACTTQPAVSEPIATPIIWLVAYTQALSVYTDSFSLCTQDLGGKVQIVTEVKSNMDAGSSNTQINLFWGAPDNSTSPYVFELGRDSLVWIVNPVNPIEELTLDELRSIYTGNVESKLISAWSYPEGQDLQLAFRRIVTGSEALNPQVYLAPDPGAMRGSVASDTTALGYIPASWLDESVKAIKIIDLPEEETSQPVVATFLNEPQDLQKKWLACIEGNIP